jgi:hypothetical protein
MISEKMNQAIDQRYEMSTFTLFIPDSDSLIASLNHEYKETKVQTIPAKQRIMPVVLPLTHCEIPKPKPAKPMLVTIGWRVGAGT